MLGVVYVAPVANDVPPVNAVYQLIVPALAVAPNATVPVPQRLAAVLAVMVGAAIKVKSTGVLTEVQEPLVEVTKYFLDADMAGVTNV